MPYLDIPLQHASPRILKAMKRPANTENTLERLAKWRAICPDITIRSTFIVGFPGETDEEFDNTTSIMEEFKYNMAYIAQYSPRPGATSSRWEDDVPKEEKKERYHRLTSELRSSAHEYNLGLVGKTIKVLVRGHDRKEGYLSAYTEGRIVARFASSNENLIGEFVDIKITSAASLSIEGELEKHYD